MGQPLPFADLPACLSIYAEVSSTLGHSSQLRKHHQEQCKQDYKNLERFTWLGMSVAKAGPCDEMRHMGQDVHQGHSGNIRNRNTLNPLALYEASMHEHHSVRSFLHHPRLLFSCRDCWHNYPILGKSYISTYISPIWVRRTVERASEVAHWVKTSSISGTHVKVHGENWLNTLKSMWAPWHMHPPTSSMCTCARICLSIYLDYF